MRPTSVGQSDPPPQHVWRVCLYLTDPVEVESLTRAMHNIGYAVKLCTSALEVIECIDYWHPHICVFESFSILKQAQTAKNNLKFVLVLDRSSETEEIARQLNADFVLWRPLDPHDPLGMTNTE